MISTPLAQANATAAVRGSSLVGYRPDIDGLRAIAVLAVVAYHTAPGAVRGGFVGVDIFFVISGFLISTIIFREKQASNFSLMLFYDRRVRRIFPALIVVLVVTAIAAWYYLLPHEFLAFGRHLYSGAAYFINYTLRREVGYFDVAASQKLLLHLWSLAIEEQFYIVWPILLFFANSRRAIITILLIMFTVSLTFNILTIYKDDDNSSAFYLPQDRMWELSTGGIVGFSLLYPANPLFSILKRIGEGIALTSGRAKDLASIAGLILIAIATLSFGITKTYPGVRAMVPCGAAALLIASGGQALVNRYLLSQTLLVSIGLISYPLYLWHWPILALLHILKLDGDWRFTTVGVLVAIGLSCVTYWLVEGTWRRAAWRYSTVTMFAVMACLCVFGIFISAGVIRPRLSDRKFVEIATAVDDWTYPDKLVRETNSSGLTVFASGVGNGKILYAGDSNIEQYWPRIEKLRAAIGDAAPVIFATRGGCPPIPGIQEAQHPGCVNFAEQVISLAERDDVKSVVLGANWKSYFDGSPYYLAGEGGGPISKYSPAWHQAFSNLARMVQELRKEGKRVWIVLNIPTDAGLDPLAGLQRSWTGGVVRGETSLDRTIFDAAWIPIRAEFARIASSTGAKLIDPMAALCDKTLCPKVATDGTFIYKDAGHLRASYARDHATFIDETLLSQLPPNAE